MKQILIISCLFLSLCINCNAQQKVFTWQEYYKQNKNSIKTGSSLTLSFQKKCTSIASSHTAAVVADYEARAKGLSDRAQQLRADEGMLFLFEVPQESSFWMKRTFIPLQLIYIRPDGKVSQTHEMNPEPNPDQPKQYYSSQEKIIAAIEVAPHTLKNYKDLQLCVHVR